MVEWIVYVMVVKKRKVFEDCLQRRVDWCTYDRYGEGCEWSNIAGCCWYEEEVGRVFSAGNEDVREANSSALFSVLFNSTRLPDIITVLSEECKFHSVWLLKRWNSCTSIFSNTSTWLQHDWNKTQKQRKNVRRVERIRKEEQWSGKKRCNDCLTLARANRPPEVDTPRRSGWIT